MQGLKALRRTRMLTQRELAEQVGVTLQAVQHWEAGTRFPRPAQQRKLCEVLKVGPEALLAALDASAEAGKEDA